MNQVPDGSVVSGHDGGHAQINGGLLYPPQSWIRPIMLPHGMQNYSMAPMTPDGFDPGSFQSMQVQGPISPPGMDYMQPERPHTAPRYGTAASQPGMQQPPLRRNLSFGDLDRTRTQQGISIGNQSRKSNGSRSRSQSRGDNNYKAPDHLETTGFKAPEKDRWYASNMRKPLIPCVAVGNRPENGVDTTFRKCYIGNLSWKTTADTLYKNFNEYGEIYEAVVIAEPAGQSDGQRWGRSRGFGFVTFVEESAAREACRSIVMVDSRQITCVLAAFGCRGGKRKNYSRSDKPNPPVPDHYGIDAKIEAAQKQAALTYSGHLVPQNHVMPINTMANPIVADGQWPDLGQPLIPPVPSLDIVNPLVNTEVKLDETIKEDNPTSTEVEAGQTLSQEIAVDSSKPTLPSNLTSSRTPAGSPVVKPETPVLGEIQESMNALSIERNPAEAVAEPGEQNVEQNA